MRIRIEKGIRRLTIEHEGKALHRCPVGLGRVPEGAKQQEGDGRTPEGVYRICLIKEQGKYGRSLGLSYPGAADAQLAHAQERIDASTLQAILEAHAHRRRPPWGSALGGEIYIHEGGSQTDWTQGCIALDAADMDVLFPLRFQIDQVIITP